MAAIIMSASAIAAARLQRSRQSPTRPVRSGLEFIPTTGSPEAASAEKVCRYCQLPERPGSAEGELIVPCNCQGFLRYVHLACLRQHQYAAARKGGGTHCEVCHARYFVGFPSVSEAAQAKCDALIQQLKPGALLVAHPEKQTSSGGAFSKTVILLTHQRRKEDVDKHSTTYRLLDQQGGQSVLIGYVLNGGAWHPPAANHSRYPMHTIGVREHRLPGGPVKAERSIITSVQNLSGALPIPLLGEPGRGLTAHLREPPPPSQASAGKPPLYLVPDPAAASQVISAANRSHSASNPALVLHCEGAAVWTDEQIVRETIAGSWGVVPARAAYAWGIGEASRDGRSMWQALVASGQPVFATDLIAAADARAAAEAAAALPAAEVAARQAWKSAQREREAQLLSEMEAASPSAPSSALASSTVSRKIGACSLPLQLSDGGFSSLLESEAVTLLSAIGDSVRFVLLGECTHGTQQFYEVRAALSRLLIERRGFQAVVVEGDWPDAQRAHRYIAGRSLKDENARAALGDFGRRFPAWMWRNAATEAFLEWAKEHNEAKAEEGGVPVGFYGMDLYSLHHSMHRVLEYLRGVDPSFAKEAQEAFAVLEPFQRDPSAYGRAMAQGQLRADGNRRAVSGVDVQRRLEGILATLQRRNEGKYEYELRYTAEERLDAEINAEVVVNAESYFRENWHALGHINTWNARDQHMVQVLMRLDIELKNTLNPVRRHKAPLGRQR